MARRPHFKSLSEPATAMSKNGQPNVFYITDGSRSARYIFYNETFKELAAPEIVFIGASLIYEGDLFWATITRLPPGLKNGRPNRRIKQLLKRARPHSIYVGPHSDARDQKIPFFFRCAPLELKTSLGELLIKQSVACLHFRREFLI
ncbi:hypothetical protein CEXT_423251 [Caerostris extrusa]|uniref:Uncharacterized protein n=1 Tax=Caerostris extrusa TaxID=172846 RepID=A0AAV4TEU9_CAEEX|nr:hypothetical protein CEXT_423251 [Caerostris extrusa]